MVAVLGVVVEAAVEGVIVEEPEEVAVVAVAPGPLLKMFREAVT